MNRFSILQDQKCCYVCGTQFNLHKHHIMKGTRNRDKAEEDGLWVYLCYNHHEGTFGVHGKYGHKLDLELIQRAEQQWLKFYNKTTDDWIKRYGRNYI